MALDDQKQTLINMVIVNAFEPEKIFSGDSIRTEMNFNVNDYSGKFVNTDQIWNSIMKMRGELQHLSSENYRKLYKYSIEISPSSIAPTLNKAGIIYKKNLAKNNDINIPVILGCWLPIFVISLLIISAIMGPKVDTRSDREKGLDAYCARLGRSGCSDTAKKIEKYYE